VGNSSGNTGSRPGSSLHDPRPVYCRKKRWERMRSPGDTAEPFSFPAVSEPTVWRPVPPAAMLGRRAIINARRVDRSCPANSVDPDRRKSLHEPTTKQFILLQLATTLPATDLGQGVVGREVLFRIART